MTAIPLSVCIITYNEEDNIQGALETVKWADDIVVIDAHSTDRTVEIARAYTERVFVRDWPGFVAQKNFALEQTHHEWVLSLDADERLVEPDTLGAGEKVDDLMSRPCFGRLV